jgi:hypothetical protein
MPSPRFRPVFLTAAAPFYGLAKFPADPFPPPYFTAIATPRPPDRNNRHFSKPLSDELTKLTKPCPDTSG